ncbi:putative proteinC TRANSCRIPTION FACTOR 56 [Salix koriyanagi]|uniref:NAC domain-containing protein n=1 Tax=Salix koriyanagi TaxID=2511006 RepID=A0A9Q0YRP5_9ROSI|nr:putative proteinC TRANSCRIPTION FACTOR 56 [Salix koriyanagi]
MCLLLLKLISTSLTHGISPAWPCMEKRNGTFLRRGTGSTLTDRGRIVLQGGATGKPREPTSRLGSRRRLESRKLWYFTQGKLPKGEKTNWIMHEYRLADVDRSARKKNSLRLDDWVLCRIYNKKGTIEKQEQHLSVKKVNPAEIEEDEKKQGCFAAATSSSIIGDRNG